MDHDEFDRLSRFIANAASRRNALGLLLASAVAGLTAATDHASARGRHRGRSHGRRSGTAQGEQVAFCTIFCRDCPSEALGPGANLTRCGFSFRDLEGVNANGSNVTRACFGDANLRDASFRGANVSGACFCGANLIGADFRGSNVTARQLACATVGCDTILPNGKPAAPCGKGERCCHGACQVGQCGPRLCLAGPPAERGCSDTPPRCTCPTGTACFQGLCCIPSGQPEASVPDFFCCSSTATAAGICCFDPFLGECAMGSECCSGVCGDDGFCR